MRQDDVAEFISASLRIGKKGMRGGFDLLRRAARFPPSARVEKFLFSGLTGALSLDIIPLSP